MANLIIDEQFILLLAGHQRRLMGFVRALVPNRADADEVLQEVNLYLTQHASDFQAGTNFAAWALKASRIEVLRWRQRQSRDRLVFDDSLLDRLSAAMAKADTQAVRREAALDQCLAKLAPRERELITRFYGELGSSPQTLAKNLGRSVNGLYVTAHRIRARLLACIQFTLAAEER